MVYEQVGNIKKETEYYRKEPNRNSEAEKYNIWNKSLLRGVISFMDHTLVVLKGLACAGPPKAHRSEWRILKKCGPLEEKMANHSSILAGRTSWTVLKVKSYDTGRWVPRLEGVQYATGEEQRIPGGEHGNLLQDFYWKILWTQEPGRLQSAIVHRVVQSQTNWSNLAHMHTRADDNYL